MTDHVVESDWKRFRKIREKALERFCARIMSEVADLAERKTPSAHERYLELYRLIQDRNREIAIAFDDPRRSAMLLQLSAIHRLGLLDDGDLDDFTAETRAAVARYLS